MLFLPQAQTASVGTPQDSCFQPIAQSLCVDGFCDRVERHNAKENLKALDSFEPGQGLQRAGRQEPYRFRAKRRQPPARLLEITALKRFKSARLLIDSPAQIWIARADELRWPWLMTPSGSGAMGS